MAAISRGTSRRFSVRILAGREIDLDGAPALVELWWPIVKGEAAGGVQGEELPLPTMGENQLEVVGVLGRGRLAGSRLALIRSYGFGFLLYEQL